MKIDILAVGDTSIDEFMQIHDASISCDVNHENCQICFDYADKVHVEKFEVSVAGNAPNVAIGCATLGLNPAIYTEIGDDPYAELAIDTMEKRGVDTSFCIKNPGTPTNVHPIAVFKGERTIFSYHEKRRYRLQNWERPKFLYYTSLSEGFEKFQTELLKYVKENDDIIFVVNPGTMQMKVGVKELRKVLTRTDVLFVNKEEAIKLSGGDLGIDGLHRELNKMGVKLSVITDSTRGSSTYYGEEVEKLGTCELAKTIDKTGAGDAYASGYISAMHYKKSAHEAMVWGSINAAGVITKIGAIEGLITKDKMELLAKTIKFKPHSLT